MKNTIKNIKTMLMLGITALGGVNAHAQDATYPAGCGNGQNCDMLWINADASDHRGQVALNTTRNSTFVLTNYFSRFGIGYGCLNGNLESYENDLFTILNTGNVGIGTTNPTQKLEVNGNAIINNAFIGDVGHSRDWAGFSHSNQKTPGGYALLQNGGGDYTLINKKDTGTGFIGFRVGNSDKAVILNNGNMGIGNSFPTAKLMVNGIGGATVDFETTGRMRIVATHPGTWLADQSNTNKAFYGYNSFSLNHAFGIWTPLIGWSAFNILQNGNVGIGTETPTQKLEVNGNAIINNAFIGDVGHSRDWAGFSHSNQKTPGGYALLQNVDGAYTLINKKDTGTGYIGFKVGNSDKAVIANNGNMGIGTTSPTQKLEVNGGVKIQDDIFKPNNGSGITWGSNYSKIKDDGNLNILTDDVFYIGKCDGAGTRTATTIFADVRSGNVGIGTESPTSKLAVKGTVTALDFAIVGATSMPDYVFAKDYKLPTLSATEAYIKVNKHLPAFKSAKEMEEKGYNVIDMDRNMLQTIEEMTLHAIAQEKTIATQEQKMNAQEQKMNAQEAKLINLSQELAEIKALLQNKK